MTITLHFPDDMRAALQARADAAGMSVEKWLEQMAARQVHLDSVARLQHAAPEEWARRLRAWAGTQRPAAPPLSEEAISRESIYTDRL